LNNALLGHQIVLFQFNSSGYCMEAQSSSYFYGGACTTGSNDAFVATSNGSSFVSVGGSDLFYRGGSPYPYDVAQVCSSVLNGPIGFAAAQTCEPSGSQVWTLENPNS
jgi:hypothetical protein